jgi:hypothetical protein
MTEENLEEIYLTTSDISCDCDAIDPKAEPWLCHSERGERDNLN